jgi:O-antigen/teichoic acid export membrane protein
LFSNIASACQETIRGFERTDIAAYSRVGLQLASLALVVPTLLLGGGVRLVLLIQALAVLLVLVPVLRSLRQVGVGKLAWDWERLKKLMAGGTPFVFFGLALTLQPNIDAFYLAKLSPSEVVGWYAVAQKLIGVLLVPATALIGALYPTLCRLYISDIESFRRTTRESIATVSLLVVPVALGCALYPDLGISIFGRAAFRPAEDTLRVASIYLFLVYFSMPIGTALVAGGRQKAWTRIQLLCVLNSAALDPFLVRYFQTTRGNGGLGLAAALSISESLMVIAGVALMPRGVFDRKLAKTLLLAVASGAVMTGTSFALHDLPSLAAAPLAVLMYGLALYLSGAVSKQQAVALADALRRKLIRTNPA